MRQKLGEITIRNILISYVILYGIMPIVARLTSRFLTTYFYMIVVVVLVVLILAMDRPDNLNLYIAFLLPFILYNFLTYFTTADKVIIWGYQVLLNLFNIILGYYFTKNPSKISLAYSKLIIIAILLTMVTTVAGCIRFPNASREIASIDSKQAISYTYDMMNIGGYEFVYMIVLLYPIVILAYKTRRIRLLPTILIAVAVFVTILFTEYTIALLLFVVSSLLFFTKRNLSIRGIVFISIASIVFAYLFVNVIVQFLDWFSHALNSDVMSTRLTALSGGTKALESSDDNRLYLYQHSLEVFIQNPLLGSIATGNGMSGGHSHILDTLAQYGIVGGVLLFFIYKQIFKQFFLPYKNSEGFGYVIWIFIQVIILSLVNTGMWLNVLCLFTPLLLYYIYEKEPLDDVWNQLREAKTAVSKK